MIRDESLFSVTRPAYSQTKFQREFARDRSNGADSDDDDADEDSRCISSKNRRNTNACASAASWCLGYLHPKRWLGMFTIINFVAEYDFRKCFLADLFSGLTG